MRLGQICWLLLFAAFLVPAVAPPPVRAHDQSFSYANVEWRRDRILVRLTVHRDDAAAVTGSVPPDALMEPDVLAKKAGRLSEFLLGGLRVLGDGQELAMEFEAAEPKPQDRAVTLSFRSRPLRRPVSRLTIECALFPAVPDHETFLTVTQGPRMASQGVLTASHPRAEAYREGLAGTFSAFATYLRTGIHHIFIGPDHILFLVGLLLLGGGLARVLKVATAFTLAHSITLAVAAVGWYSPPGWVVEPVIALGIVYVGAENLRSRPAGGDWRMRVAFCFGLVHGFGFAGVLREVGLPREAMGWALLAFNVGVEVGQALIVTAVLPVLGCIGGLWPRVAPRAIAACSWAIIVAGTFWFLERVIEPARLLSSRF